MDVTRIYLKNETNIICMNDDVNVFHEYYAPCNGAMKSGGTWGGSFIEADWRMRVFGSSGLVYRPPDRLYVRTILLSGCMDRCSLYIPFSSHT